MDNKTKVRNWDIAKGIAILSLLMGNIDGIPPLMKAIIFSFSIPLLFAASDYCREKYDLKDTLIRSSKGLLLRIWQSVLSQLVLLLIVTVI